MVKYVNKSISRRQVEDPELAAGDIVVRRGPKENVTLDEHLSHCVRIFGPLYNYQASD